ncbi:hypothetical protein CTZ27_20925 [Streptomyces griseocarneus]|nr:hypothetical protein CTZ27_20925 [Streptomyces griseocarneus]
MRSIRRNVLLTAVSVATCATALGVPSAQAAGAGTERAAPLTWHACAEDSARDCATLPVPLDYANPTGPTTDLAVTRLRSDHPEKRRGTLLMISGGPGGSGREMVARSGKRLREETKGAYDLVGLDPRGVGGSEPADCGVGEDDRRLVNFRPWPKPDGDIGETVARARRVADACARSGALVRSISTANEVRDLDRFRQALGERKLSGWGVSYGAYVGAVYAQRYPQHTDRWVLDSSGDPDPARVERGWLANMSVGADDRFPDFAKWASDPARGKQRIADKPEDVKPKFMALAAGLDRKPRTFADTHNTLDGNALRQIMQIDLYADEQFPELAGLMRAAGQPGDAPLDVKDPLPEPISQSEAAVMTATLCNDVTWPTSVSSYERAVAADRAAHPLLAGMPAGILPCAFWKGGTHEKPTRLTSDGPRNILMVQNLRDPATPYTGAMKMRQAFGDRARMVKVDAGGHGSYLRNGNACGDGAVTRYFLTGQRPERDVLCSRSS